MYGYIIVSHTHLGYKMDLLSIDIITTPKLFFYDNCINGEIKILGRNGVNITGIITVNILRQVGKWPGIKYIPLKFGNEFPNIDVFAKHWRIVCRNICNLLIDEQIRIESAPMELKLQQKHDCCIPVVTYNPYRRGTVWCKLIDLAEPSYRRIEKCSLNEHLDIIDD